MTAIADLLYGRRGGRWASPDAGRHAEAIAQALAANDRGDVEFDPRQVFHPDWIARARAHDRRRRGTCAKDQADNRDDRRRTACTCAIDPDDLAGIWAGRARMARARLHTGQALDDIDRQALAHPAAQTTAGLVPTTGPASHQDPGTGVAGDAAAGAGQLALEIDPHQQGSRPVPTARLEHAPGAPHA